MRAAKSHDLDFVELGKSIIARLKLKNPLSLYWLTSRWQRNEFPCSILSKSQRSLLNLVCIFGKDHTHQSGIYLQSEFLWYEFTTMSVVISLMSLANIIASVLSIVTLPFSVCLFFFSFTPTFLLTALICDMRSGIALPTCSQCDRVLIRRMASSLPLTILGGKRLLFVLFRL